MAQEVTNNTVRIDQAPRLVEEWIGHRFNVSTLRRWATEGKFKSFKLGGIRFVDVSSLRTYLDTKKGSINEVEA